MPLDQERAVWLAIPAGTPSQPRRISVAVSPRIEGTGTATLVQLKRFGAWPGYLTSVKLSLRINGRVVKAAVKTANDLQPDDQLWRRIFAPTLEIDLADPKQADHEATKHEDRTPLAPPTAEAAAVIKQVYRERVAQQAEPGLAPATFRSRTEPPRTEVEVASWASYISQLQESGSSESDDLHARAMVLMRKHELFHSRPPLKVFPDLIRDERELHSAQEGSAAGRMTRLPSLAEQANDTAAVSLSAREEPLVVAAYGVDRLGRHAIGLRLRLGDQVNLRSDGQAWQFDRVVVQVQAADDRSTLYARHVLSPTATAHPFEFRLPDQPPPGFTVLIRSLVSQAVQVVATVGSLRVDLQQGEGKAFRWTPQGWAIDSENRQDFHGRVASLLPYPDLRRRLGLVVDLELDASVNLPPTGLLRVVPEGAAATLDLCPWTAFEFDMGRWLFLPARRDPDTSSLLQGLLRNDSGRTRFKIVQMDTDSAALAMLHQARTQAVADDDAKQGNPHPVDLQLRGNPQQGNNILDTPVIPW